MSLMVVNGESCASRGAIDNGNRVIVERRGAVIVVRRAVLESTNGSRDSLLFMSRCRRVSKDQAKQDKQSYRNVSKVARCGQGSAVSEPFIGVPSHAVT